MKGTIPKSRDFGAGGRGLAERHEEAQRTKKAEARSDGGGGKGRESPKTRSRDFGMGPNYLLRRPSGTGTGTAYSFFSELKNFPHFDSRKIFLTKGFVLENPSKFSSPPFGGDFS